MDTDEQTLVNSRTSALAKVANTQFCAHIRAHQWRPLQQHYDTQIMHKPVASLIFCIEALSSDLREGPQTGRIEFG